MIYSIYINATGEIVRVADIDPADIAAQTPAGSTATAVFANDNSQYFPSGVLTQRPILTAESSFNITADGVDEVRIPVPAGTMIVCNTIKGGAVTTAGEDFVFTSVVPASDEFVLWPPFPYVLATFWIYSGGIVSKEYEKVKAVHIAPAAIEPSKIYRNPAGNQVTDAELLEHRNCYFFEKAASGGALTELPSENVAQSRNPDDDGFGESDFKFTVTGLTAGQNLLIETDRLSPVEPGSRYEVSYFGLTENTNALSFGVGVKWYKTDDTGALELLAAEERLVAYTVAPDVSKRVFCAVLAPAGASFASLAATINRNAFVGTEIASCDFSTPVIRRLPNSRDVAQVAQDLTPSSQTFGAASEIIATVQVPSTDYRKFRAVLHWGFHHNSGSAKDIDVGLYYFTTGSYGVGGSAGSTIMDTISINARNDEYYSGTAYTDVDLSNIGGARNFELVLTGAAGGNSVNRVSLIADVRFIDQVDN